MSLNVAQHYSHSFELKLDKLPTKKSDRIALKILLPGIVLGFIAVFIGIADMFTRGNRSFGSAMPVDVTKEIHSFINPLCFDIVMIFLGVWIIVSLFMSYVRYKKVFYDGKSIVIVQRPAIGKKKSFKEELKKYDGVCLRIEFFQFGFMRKRRYIIELSNKNINKVAPLYISTNSKNLRHIWKRYAKELGLPALFLTDEGMVARGVQDLDKSIIELIKKKKIKNDFDKKQSMPAAIAYTRKKDKTVIKSRRIRWDAFNVVYWVFMLFFVIFAVLVIGINGTVERAGAVMVIALAFLALYVFCYAKKEKVVVKPHKIVIVQKFMLFSRKKDEIAKENIEAIEVGFNPINNRHYLVISSENREVIFGEKMSSEELKWVKGFLINEIVK